MMVTHTGTPQLRIAIVTVLSIMVFSLRVASAQSPADACATYPEGSLQTIGVELDGGECKIDLDTKIDLMREYPNGTTYWEVCNKCGAPVDVKIYGSSPNNLSSLFSMFSPPIDASETSTARNISSDQQRVYFRGRVAGDAPESRNKYAVAVKFTTEGEAGWDEFDPELQIDANFRDFNLRLLQNPNPLMGIVAILLVLLGLGIGFWIGRRGTVAK